MGNIFWIVILVESALVLILFAVCCTGGAALKKRKMAFYSGLFLGYTDAMQDVINDPDMDKNELVERYVKMHGLEEMIDDQD